MRFRIGQCNERYWVEGKRFLRWRRLPSLTTYKDYPTSRYVQAVKYYPSYEAARLGAEGFIAELCPSAAVYVNVR
jgi:hypothetical protein